MRIGNVDLGDSPVVLAPMEDVTDESFRLICREQGADMAYTEFISADALVRNIASTTRKLNINPSERPCAIQIYGRDIDTMVEAAKMAEEASPEIIDLNFGCPVKKVSRKGAGAGMLRDVPKLLAITKAVANAVKCPVTVKTRLGWDHENKIIVELAERLQDCGISALTIHGRTRSQMYAGEADWELIGEVKNNQRMKIPIIGNGDINSPLRAREAFEKYGVDGIMVGRASIGAPWIFAEIKALLTDKQTSIILSSDYKMNLLRRQIKESIERLGERRGIVHIRRHLAASPLFKGIANFRETRIAMLRTETEKELNVILNLINSNYLCGCPN